jgi:hypothetical protein
LTMRENVIRKLDIEFRNNDSDQLNQGANEGGRLWGNGRCVGKFKKLYMKTVGTNWNEVKLSKREAFFVFPFCLSPNGGGEVKYKPIILNPIKIHLLFCLKIMKKLSSNMGLFYFFFLRGVFSFW